MRLRLPLVALFVSLSILSSRAAALPPTCDELQKPVIPPGDVPQPTELAGLTSRDADRHYYGIGTPVDYAAARRAAFAGPFEDGTPPYDAEILTMLYANGYGVKRNVELAMSLSCTIPYAAAAELDGRLTHLWFRRHDRGPKRFDICDDVTSTMMNGYCEAIQSQLADQRRAKVLAKLVARFPGPERAAFARLEAARDAYAQARGDLETDLTGTARATYATAAEQGVKKAFLAALQRFERGKRPAKSAVDEAERALDEALAAAQTLASQDMTLTSAGLKQAQEVWTHYRDAWLELAKLRYPKTPTAAFRTWLVSQRTAELHAMLDELRP